MVNPRVKDMRLSHIRTVMERTAALERQGREIVHLEIGEPDFRTPDPIVSATIKALQQGYTHYGPDEGIHQLRELIACRIERDKGIKVDPYKNVIITVGASEAIFDAIVGLTGPGQKVIIPEPAFGNYRNCCLCAGSTPVSVPLDLGSNCSFDFHKLEEIVDSSTTCLILNNPHNPTGAKFKAAEIKALASFAVKHDLIVIADDIYEEIYYGPEKPLPIASLPGMSERTVMISGFSKAYAMTGWRIGYAVAPEHLYEPIQKVHQYVVTCVPTFTQIGIAESAEECRAAVRTMVEELNTRREFLTRELDQIDGLTYVKPEGAFYLFVNIRQFGLDSEEFARQLLEDFGLAVIPGTTFGPSGEGYIRLSYAAALADLKKGMVILKKYIEDLKASR